MLEIINKEINNAGDYKKYLGKVLLLFMKPNQF